MVPIKKILQRKNDVCAKHLAHRECPQNKYLLPSLLLVTFLHLLSHLVLRDS